jgi:hypothetical protein
MRFWPISGMIELVSGIPAPQFGGRIFASARIRAGSRLKTISRTTGTVDPGLKSMRGPRRLTAPRGPSACYKDHLTVTECLERGLEAHPKTLPQDLHAALTAAATVHTGNLLCCVLSVAHGMQRRSVSLSAANEFELK